MKTLIRVASAIVAVALLAEPTGAVTKRIFHVGNSLTDQVKYSNFKSVAESRGHTHVWGRQMIPGAPLGWNWDHPGEGFTEPPFGGYYAALTGYDWDALVLQPFQWGFRTEADYATRFASLALRRYPQTNVYIHMTWPAHNGGLGTFETQWLSDVNATNRSRAYFEFVADSVTATHGADRVFVVPNGEVMYEIDKRIRGGTLTAISSVWDLYADEIHLNDVGSYLVMITHFATIYQESPIGLGTGGLAISPTQAGAIQQVVHDVVLAYGRAKVDVYNTYAVTGVLVLPQSVELNTGRSATVAAEVYPGNAANRVVAWSSSATGVATVNSSGVVTPVAPGTANIIATTSQGSFKDTCVVTVVSSGTAVTGVSLSPASDTVLVGQTITYSATLVPAGSTNAAVTFRTIDTAVATVNASGVVSGRKKGLTTLVVTTVNGGVSDTSEVRVAVPNTPPVPVFVINPAAGYAGATFKFGGGGSYDNDPGDFVLGFDWDFGDGSPLDYAVNTRHVYPDTGSYSVRFRAMDANGERSAWVSQVVRVQTRASGVLLYEGFESANGTIDQGMGGYGWYTNAWGGDAGSVVSSASTMEYTGLETRGRYLQNAWYANRNVDTRDNGDFSGYIDQGYVGVTDSSLWVSILVRKENLNERGAFMEFHPSQFDCCDPGFLQIGYLGTSTNNGGTRYFGVGFDADVRRSAVSITVDQTYLLVARIRWQSTSTTVDLYVNPPQIGGAAPASPSFTTTINQHYHFRNISLHSDWGTTGEVCFDELRIGKSFAAVTPVGTPVRVTEPRYAPAGSARALEQLWQHGLVKGSVRAISLDGRVVWSATVRTPARLPDLPSSAAVVEVRDGREVITRTLGAR